jgi:hypothetical protein
VYGGAQILAGSGVSQPEEPSELAQQLPEGFASHVQPDGQSLAAAQPTIVSRQAFSVLGSQTQSAGTSRSGGVGAAPASAGTPASEASPSGASALPASAPGVGVGRPDPELSALPALGALPLPVEPPQAQSAVTTSQLKPVPQSDAVSHGGT